MNSEVQEIADMRAELAKVNVTNTGWALRVIFKVLFRILELLERPYLVEVDGEPITYEPVEAEASEEVVESAD